LLDSVDAVIQYARTMTWKGRPTPVELVTTTYQTGFFGIPPRSGSPRFLSLLFIAQFF
jgi:hypothetical protein